MNSATFYICGNQVKRMAQPTITDTIMMVRPANFGFNLETAANNSFQTNDPSRSTAEIRQSAREEFDAFVVKLRAAGVRVVVIEDTPEPIKHDAVFPNNWFSTHAGGTLVTYPVFAPMRRLERRADIVDQLVKEFGYTRRLQLEDQEVEERYLEGTGSLILDRENKIVYACRSIRTHDDLMDEFSVTLGYEKFLFDATDRQGDPIYHTNVMMAIGTTFCVICLDSIRDKTERKKIVDRLESAGKEIVEITLAQMESFAGNMLQVISKADRKLILVMSQQAFESLEPAQITQLLKHTTLLHSDLRTIETYGGGSARCMMAEIFAVL